MNKLDAMTNRVLESVEPVMAFQVRRVLAAMASLGFPMAAYDGLRTAARQRELYAQGRTAPGRIVTYLDGVSKKSRHQTGRAVDCAFVGDDGKSLKWDGPWPAYGNCAEACGLLWGGRWEMSDKPHIELRG